MIVLRSRFWTNLLFFLLATVSLTGCRQQTESTLTSYAERVVSALEFDIVEQHHYFTVAGLDGGVPSSEIASTYLVSNAPEEVKDRLRGLYPAGETWLEYSEGELIGEVPIGWAAAHADYVKETIRRKLLSKSRPGLTVDEEHPPEIDLLLICPWYWTFDEDYTTQYSDVIILTKEGILVIEIHKSAWTRCHSP